MLPAGRAVLLPGDVLPPDGLLGVLHEVPGQGPGGVRTQGQQRRAEWTRGTGTRGGCGPRPWGPAPYRREGPLSLVVRGGRPGACVGSSVKAKVPLMSGGYRSLCSCFRKSSAPSEPASSSKAILSSCARQEALRDLGTRGSGPGHRGLRAKAGDPLGPGRGRPPKRRWARTGALLTPRATSRLRDLVLHQVSHPLV